MVRGYRRDSYKPPTQEAQKAELIELLGRTKINQDSYNAWSGLILVYESEYHPFDRLTPVPSYEEYHRRSSIPEENRWIQEVIMQHSNPDTVAIYNDLVKEFNSDLERIKTQRDMEKIKDFLRRIQMLIYGKISIP